MRVKLFPWMGVIIGLLWIGTAMATEEPKYEVVQAQPPFEVRRYAPTLIAEVVVDGAMDEATRKGFRLIADYIFGNNQSPGSEEKSKIAMTAPVTVEPQSSNIAMTAPVTVAPQSAHHKLQTAMQWRVHFVMPSQYTLASIPKPKNKAVSLRELPSSYYVVHSYSGFNTIAKVQTKTDETLAWATQQSLRVIGTPQLARYDPPWTLPMFRRNEIMVEVAAP
jgi:hypothetical protein